MSKHRPSLFGTIVAILTALTALGIYFLVISNQYGHKYTGTLIESETEFSKSSKSGGAWYVKEIFLKESSSNDTCSVRRPTQYFTAHDANTANNKVKLGTTRTIWTYWNDDSTCYDQNIKKENTIVGSCLLSFGIGAPLLYLLYLIYSDDSDESIFSCFRSSSSEDESESGAAKSFGPLHTTFQSLSINPGALEAGDVLIMTSVEEENDSSQIKTISP